MVNKLTILGLATYLTVGLGANFAAVQNSYYNSAHRQSIFSHKRQASMMYEQMIEENRSPLYMLNHPFYSMKAKAMFNQMHNKRLKDMYMNSFMSERYSPAELESIWQDIMISRIVYMMDLGVPLCIVNPGFCKGLDMLVDDQEQDTAQEWLEITKF